MAVSAAGEALHDASAVRPSLVADGRRPSGLATFTST